MKNILAVIGGGRPKGNTEQLVDAFAQGAETAGNQVEKICCGKQK
jgi:multimeric flavodoxin WrbA